MKDSRETSSNIPTTEKSERKIKVCAEDAYKYLKRVGQEDLAEVLGLTQYLHPL